METPVLITLLVSAIIFALIFHGKIHRTIVAWGGSIVILLIGKFYGFLNESIIFEFIDFNVIGLLLGMMTIASILELSGFFEFVAIKFAKASKGKPWLLLILLGTGNTVISLFIDNVTSIILFAPITICTIEPTARITVFSPDTKDSHFPISSISALAFSS